MDVREALMADAMAAFAVFARHRNFTHAAQELHIAQPSLHAKITKLSRTLDATLYERVGRELHLTEDGEALAAFAADQERATDDFLTRFDDRTRALHVVAGRAAIQWVLEKPLRSVVGAGTKLRVTPADGATAIDLVETGGADIAAVAYNPPSNDQAA